MGLSDFKDMKRLLILAMVVGGLVFGFSVKTAGAATLLPAQNPLCWEEAACKAAVEKQWTYIEALNFKPTGDGECGTDRGYCIPATKAQTAITVGDNSVFNNLGDYIKNIYIYLIGIGGLIAAVLVIKGGFEYVTSTGNSQRVEGAKETIRNALFGLALLLGSYTLLYTINPDLLKLKLPRTYMLREIALPSRWCKDQAKGTMVALAVDNNSSPKKEYPLTKDTTFNIDILARGDSGPACGKSYYRNSGGDTCAGHICGLSLDGKHQICVPEIGKQDGKCQEGILSGTITGDLEYPFVGWVQLKGVCNETGIIYQVTGQLTVDRDDTNKREQVFVLSAGRDDLLDADDCPQGIAGFFLETNPRVGDVYDYRYVFLKDGTLSTSLNFKKVLSGIEERKADPARFALIKDHLISQGQLLGGNTIINMVLNRQEFPAK